MPPKGRKHCRKLPPDFLSDLPDNVINVILMRLPCKEAVRTTSYQRNGGPITKFSLDIAVLKSCPNIDNFVHFLSRNDIQQLFLELPWGFDKLISLKVCNVTISPELLGSLISQCPLLDKLELEISEDSLSDVIEINAPKLRSFDFTGNITFICLMNVPLLAEVSLSLYQGSSMEADYFFFAMFFELCTALERLFLHFNSSEIEPEDDDEVATRLPFDVNCVKYFYLRFLFLEESYDLSHVLCCIRSFPYLEYLEIQVGFGDDGIVESLELEHFTDLTLNHLREIKVERYEGTPPEMQLVKLLLAKSLGLVRMLIDTWIPDDTIVSRPGAFTEVSKFWRASPKAQVVHKA
ncbi:hypothetical protein R3W88_028568 [Solanum pinnatisectum]|uniref:F-box/LRR-repeat protein 15/At3g58940/PEG3-like LRR domain-containing protein n=1 Tax=Solanum pinnatisectum TaxID=50273 RepID=A0AAV9K392_9SOLN|nr:hypothetical protein R3W88_028568 [Solanum pinnatisectum]